MIPSSKPYQYYSSKPKPIRLVMPPSVVKFLYDDGRISEEEWKKYMLSDDPHYLPTGS